MMDYIILVAIFVIVFILATVKTKQNSSKCETSIPGITPRDKRVGNFPDISKAGSFHEFLVNLHQTYGPIAGFWWGPKYTVSIGSAALFKDNTKSNERAEEFYELFKPIFGDESVAYLTGPEAKRRLAPYAKCFKGTAINQSFPVFQEITKEFVDKWSSIPMDEHIVLRQDSFNFAIKGLLRGSLGGAFKADSKVHDVRKAYDVVWNEMEERLLTGYPEPNSPRMKIFNNHKDLLYDYVHQALVHRRNNSPGVGEYQMIDAIMELDLPDSVTVQELVTVLVSGFHTTGLLLTWSLYFIARHQEVQEKLYEEVKNILGEEEIDHENLMNLKYLEQVLKETLRCSVLAPYSARVHDCEIQIGGHTIPARTPVVNALGVSLIDPEVYPEPNKFDPERFSPQNIKKIPKFGFEPFGFDKRMCPGYVFSKTETCYLLAEIVRKFEIVLVEDQIVTPVYGLVTNPREEIWITVKKRF